MRRARGIEVVVGLGRRERQVERDTASSRAWVPPLPDDLRRKYVLACC